MSARLVVVAVALACGAACAPEAIPGTQVQMRFTRDGFYDAPFPSADLMRSDGTIDLSRFPDPDDIDIVEQSLALLLQDARGFGVSSGVFFTVDGALGPLPSLAGSVRDDATVFLIGVERGAADFGVRTPVRVSFDVDGGPFGAPRLLSLVPLQGAPLLPRARYAAVVLRALGDASGAPLGVSLQMRQLAAGADVDGLAAAAHAEYASALDALDELGVRRDDIAGLAVFTTDDPTAVFRQVTDDALARLPAPAPFVAADAYDDYCVYSSTVSLPVYQGGAPPYTSTGGGWRIEDGAPVVDHEESARVFLTVPRRAMPAQGFPLVVFVRTGGGGDRPLIDRGVRDAEGNAEPGTGYAQELARVGYAGLSVDGPHGGPRNVSGGDEQFLMFNVFNPAALRDNVRQSALETVLAAHIAAALDVDVAACAGADAPGGARFSPRVVMGHSMGATIAPLALAHEPLLQAAVLSGAGGSYIENMLHKLKPVDVKATARLLLHYDERERDIVGSDPVLSLVQWAAEPSDPQVYARYATRTPYAGERRQVLMLQGIVDHYIMPPIANALSVAMGLDLGGEPLDATTPELDGLDTIEELLPFSGGARVALPATAGGPLQVVVQHAEDGVEDGHEVAFQKPLAKLQVRCFLDGLALGSPVVVGEGAADCAR